MTERLADVSARITGIRQLGAVVNAMKGIAAARAHVARKQIDAIDSYAAHIATAMSSVLSSEASEKSTPKQGNPVIGRTGLLVFCAEQGFAGAFSERVLDSIEDDLEKTQLFLIGTRGLSVAVSRGVTPFWTAPMSSHTPAIPKLADEITKAIYRGVDEDNLKSLDVVFASWKTGRPHVRRQPLFPIDLTEFPFETSNKPLTQLPAQTLIADLSADYFHAQVCKAALHAFTAENEARMGAMSSAGSQIDHELEVFQATLRRVRQEAITEEIIELGAGLMD